MRHDINWKRDRTRIWEDRGAGHFTSKGIPGWVRKELAYRGGGLVIDRMADLFKEVAMREKGKSNIIKFDDEVHFNKAGYESIFQYVRRLELMRESDIDKWHAEIFGEKA